MSSCLDTPVFSVVRSAVSANRSRSGLRVGFGSWFPSDGRLCRLSEDTKRAILSGSNPEKAQSSPQQADLQQLATGAQQVVTGTWMVWQTSLHFFTSTGVSTVTGVLTQYFSVRVRGSVT